jgi:hypothetical protein
MPMYALDPLKPEEELIRALFVASLLAHCRLYRRALTHWRNPGHLRFPTFRWKQLNKEGGIPFSEIAASNSQLVYSKPEIASIT